MGSHPKNPFKSLQKNNFEWRCHFMDVSTIVGMLDNHKQLAVWMKRKQQFVFWMGTWNKNVFASFMKRALYYRFEDVAYVHMFFLWECFWSSTMELMVGCGIYKG
jgi:hypothetical protein